MTRKLTWLPKMGLPKLGLPRTLVLFCWLALAVVVVLPPVVARADTPTVTTAVSTRKVEAGEPFSLVLARRAAGAPDVRELSRNDLDVSYFDGDTLDVSPIAEERVQMSIPMKPLCREDCLGLCPRCGKDRNVAPCDCAQEESDPRWGALEQWKNATKSQKA